MLRGLFRQPEIIMGTWRAARAEHDDVTEDEAREALLQLDPLWHELFPAEQERMLQLLIERVDVRMKGVEVRLRPSGLAGLLREVAASKQDGRTRKGSSAAAVHRVPALSASGPTAAANDDDAREG